MVKKTSRQQQPVPEIDPEKWSEFESTLKRALDMPHKPHKKIGKKKRASAKQAE
jgi:hypothetical protein